MKKAQLFLILYFVVILACFIIMAIFSKADIHLFINSLNNNIADHFFKTITNIGDGLFVVIIGVLFLLYRTRVSVNIISTYIISGLAAQIIKRLIDAPRPIAFFEGTAHLHLVEGVKMATVHSFPSGHTASIFALSLCLAFAWNKKITQVIWLLLACIVAYSRMYLSQHFLIDVTAGSIIGITTTLIFTYFSDKWNYAWLDKPIYSIKN
ncbi:MAG TPA: phosphatase PAP2 family protein [Bacteroidales bacterium]|nr:phosphatase PAP2 family protein [Bacteroidales bacterium]